MNRSVFSALLLLTVASASVHAQESYTIIDLGGIGTLSDTTGAMAINNRGQIVGTGKLNRQTHMFLLTPTKMPGV